MCVAVALLNFFVHFILVFSAKWHLLCKPDYLCLITIYYTSLNYCPDQNIWRNEGGVKKNRLKLKLLLLFCTALLLMYPNLFTARKLATK